MSDFEKTLSEAYSELFKWHKLLELAHKELRSYSAFVDDAYRPHLRWSQEVAFRISDTTLTDQEAMDQCLTEMNDVAEKILDIYEHIYGLQIETHSILRKAYKKDVLKLAGTADMPDKAVSLMQIDEASVEYRDSMFKLHTFFEECFGPDAEFQTDISLEAREYFAIFKNDIDRIEEFHSRIKEIRKEAIFFRSAKNDFTYRKISFGLVILNTLITAAVVIIVEIFLNNQT